MRVLPFVLSLAAAASLASATRCKPAAPSSSSASPSSSSSAALPQITFNLIAENSDNANVQSQPLESSSTNNAILLDIVSRSGLSALSFTQEARTGYLTSGSLYVGYYYYTRELQLVTQDDIDAGVFTPVACSPGVSGVALSCAPRGLPNSNVFAVLATSWSNIVVYLVDSGSISPDGLVSLDLVPTPA